MRWIVWAAGCGWWQEYGRTALMLACERGDTVIVALLVAVPGVDVNVATVSGVSGGGGETHACML